MAAALAAVAARGLPAAPAPRVLFVLGQGGGALQLAGRGTNADAFIRLAGGANAFGEAEGYTAITPEAVVAAAPHVILVLERTVEVAGGLDALLGRADLALTPAARERRVVVLPDAALNFGPSLGAFVAQFAGALNAAYAPAAR
jgi:iron complex transport system substrate-binding protein